MADANKLVQRNQFATYMDCGIDSKEDNRLMGDGFTSLVENKNAKEYSRQYVNMATEATDVVGYAPSIAYTADTYSQDPCIKKIMDVTDRWNRRAGDYHECKSLGTCRWRLWKIL